jgi:hypothetical protein
VIASVDSIRIIALLLVGHVRTIASPAISQGYASPATQPPITGLSIIALTDVWLLLDITITKQRSVLNALQLARSALQHRIVPPAPRTSS